MLSQNIKKTIKLALLEDIKNGDITSDATIPLHQVSSGSFLVKSDGISAGIEIAKETFNQVDSIIKFETFIKDGSKVITGDILAKVTGPTKSLLKAERTALNFIQRMSGIATQTTAYAQAVKPYKAKVLDTRKTAPGLRELDKLAVKAGGGYNHRFGLYDMILIKDNHIAAAGGVINAVKKAKQFSAGKFLVEVEIKNIDGLKEVLSLPANQLPDRIMLDNMSVDQMHEAVKITKGKIPLEASGNVNLKTINKIASTGVDYISVGALTHSVTAMDISLKIFPINREVKE